MPKADDERYVAQRRPLGAYWARDNESLFINEEYARGYAADCNAGRKQFCADKGVGSSIPWVVVDTLSSP